MIDERTTFFGKCKGITKAGLPCRRSIIFSNELCKAHGGKNSAELVKASMDRERERLARQIARWDRKNKRLLRKIELCVSAAKG
ncbi:hypothetical protein AYO46_07510 [Betaproteobacteria bacterium SCGC AG-212-J23]|nr:hypothetical protein AYO46_07510 [Betaproteobacteria bacterium SCGC AG-212-J23]